MLTARLVLLLVAACCTLTAGAEYEDDYAAPMQIDTFPRALRSVAEMPAYQKKWANQVRFGKRSAGGSRSWASQVRFG